MKVTLHGTTTTIPESVFDGLEEIYHQLENIRIDCNMCGTCCDFADFDHQLWVTEIELLFLIRHHGLRRPTSPGICPYLEGDRCGARQGRTLGCRVFGCQSVQTEMEAVHESYFAKIQALAKSSKIAIHYREFLDALQNAKLT